MSGRNAEIAREIGRLSDAGDFDALRRLIHPDAVMTAPDGWPESGPWEGRDAVMRQFKRLAEDYTERQSVLTEITTAGERSVGLLRWRVRARRSGIEAELEVWFANRLEDGLVIENRYFWTREEAFAAAGLED